MISKDINKKFLDNPKFFRFFPSEGNQISYWQKTHVHIFIGDVNLGVVPFRFAQQENENIEANVSGIDAEQAYGILQSLAEYKEKNKRELIFKVVSTIIRNMLYSGRIHYEINLKDNQYYLNYFTSHGLHTFFNVLWQRVPKVDREWLKKRGAINFKSRIWIIEIPKSLGGKQGYLRLIKELAEDSDMFPARLGEDIFKKLNEYSFDSIKYHKNQKIRIHSVLQNWGGIQRDFSLDDVNEFYLIYRITQFERSKAILREYVIAQLNDLFKRLKLDAQISVSGIPTVENIEDVLKKMHIGDVSLDQVRELTKV